jgi:phospholipase/carboxylesterase
MIHQGQPVLRAGEPLEKAKAAMLMAHGRGATARDILSLAAEFKQPGFAYLAPQAAGNSWWPRRFIDPLASNEPELTSALQVIGELLKHLEGAGIPSERTMLLGFSQGACLVLEYAARSARRYGGIAGLSGGLVGPDGTPRDYAGSLDGTPIFLGCSDVDFHIPKARVLHTAELLQSLGAQVTTRLYPDMDHTVSADEVVFVSGMMRRLTQPQ